jgi:hypothetical protein
MANETTTTTLNDLTNASLVEPYLIAALSEQPGLYRFAKEFDLRGKPTKRLDIPTETSWWGSPNDNAAGVDTEFDATEATVLSNTAVSTGVVSLTAAEYGVAIEVTDNVEEDSVDGLDVMLKLEQRMLHVMSLAMEADFLALFGSLSNNIGTSGSPLTVANLLKAITDIRIRGTIADSLVAVLSNTQATNLQDALIATNAAAAVFALSADRILNYNPSADRGLSAQRQVASFAGVPVFTSGLVPTANLAVDAVGAAFTPSTAFNDNAGHVTYGMAWKRLPRFEVERNAKMRTTDLVMTCRWGCAEMTDGSATKLTTIK